MNTFLFIVLAILVIMVVVSLVRGIVAFLKTTRIDLESGEGETVTEMQLMQNRAMFARIGATLTAHGLGFDDVFKCTVFLADMGEWPAFNAIYAEHFAKGRYPTRSALGVNGLALGARVEMECWAWNPPGD